MSYGEQVTLALKERKRINDWLFRYGWKQVLINNDKTLTSYFIKHPEEGKVFNRVDAICREIQDQQKQFERSEKEKECENMEAMNPKIVYTGKHFDDTPDMPVKLMFDQDEEFKKAKVPENQPILTATYTAGANLLLERMMDLLESNRNSLCVCNRLDICKFHRLAADYEKYKELLSRR